jgi:hypothetical protein
VSAPESAAATARASVQETAEATALLKGRESVWEKEPVKGRDLAQTMESETEQARVATSVRG